MPDIGVKESGGVDYKKISEERYLLCASFRTKSDGYTVPGGDYVNSLQADSLKSGVALDVNTHFTKPYSLLVP